MGRSNWSANNFANIDVRELKWFEATLTDEEVAAEMTAVTEKWRPLVPTQVPHEPITAWNGWDPYPNGYYIIFTTWQTARSPWELFDRKRGQDGWRSGGNISGLDPAPAFTGDEKVQWGCPESKRVVLYELFHHDGGEIAARPKNWKLVGSSDGTNWTLVDERTDAWADTTMADGYTSTGLLECSAPGDYTMYTFVFEANYGAAEYELSEIEMWELN